MPTDRPTSRQLLLKLNSDGLHDSFLRSEEHTSELQSQSNIVCRLLLGKNTSDGPPTCASCRTRTCRSRRLVVVTCARPPAPYPPISRTAASNSETHATPSSAP